MAETARQAKNYALASESLPDDESEQEKESTMAAVETLRNDNCLAKAESAATREGKRCEGLLQRAVKFGVVDANAAEKIGDSVRHEQESCEHYVSILSKKLPAYRYELS